MKRKKEHNKDRPLRLSFILFGFTPFLLLSYPAYSQPKNDTLFITQPGEYPVYKHLYIYETDSKMSPQFVYDSVQDNHFIRLFPNKSFNNSTSAICCYWLMLTIKNNLAKDETFYYWLNSAGLSVVKGYQKEEARDFQFIGNSGFFTPIQLRQSQSHDAEFHFVVKEMSSSVIIIGIENPTGQDAFFLPQLADANKRTQIHEHMYLVVGIIGGIMLIAFVLNIFFAISLQENIHYL